LHRLNERIDRACDLANGAVDLAQHSGREVVKMRSHVVQFSGQVERGGVVEEVARIREHGVARVVNVLCGEAFRGELPRCLPMKYKPPISVCSKYQCTFARRSRVSGRQVVVHDLEVVVVGQQRLHGIRGVCGRGVLRKRERPLATPHPCFCLTMLVKSSWSLSKPA